MFKKYPEILLSKHIDDLPSIDNVLLNPRAWSPEALEQACNNLKFSSTADLDPIENLTVQFLFKKLFFLMHQTGLYNLQRKLWSLLAQAKTIQVKKSDKISDIVIKDIYHKYIVVRLLHPASGLNFPGLSKLLSIVDPKCLGQIYISDLVLNDYATQLIEAKEKNLIDALMALCGYASYFNIIQYVANQDSLNYHLVYPKLGRQASALLQASDLDLVAKC